MKGILKYIRVKLFTFAIWAFALLLMLSSCGAKKRAASVSSEETVVCRMETSVHSTDSANTEAIRQAVEKSTTNARIEIERYVPNADSSSVLLTERILVNIEDKKKKESSELEKAQELHLLTISEDKEETSSKSETRTETTKTKDPFPWWLLLLGVASIFVTLKIRKHLIDRL